MEEKDPEQCPKAESVTLWQHGTKRPPHPCPFKQEIHDDRDTLCECCENCTHECAMDV